MVKNTPSAVVSKIGVNFVRSLVEAAGSLFHKLEHESDLGIDAIIEIVVEGRPVGIQVAAQIKSGKSYFQSASGACVFPIHEHGAYWARYPIPIVGLVYVPELKRAHWVDLKKAIANAHDRATVRFTASEVNAFDRDSFESLFVPLCMRTTPVLTLSRALSFAHSTEQDEVRVGHLVLFRRYPNDFATWNTLIEHLVEAPIEHISPMVAHYLAHIPWHDDIAYTGEPIRSDVRAEVASRIASFRREDIIRLLTLVDRETGIARGSIGQSVEAVISSLPDIDDVLASIANDKTLDLFVSECAAFILAMHSSTKAVPLFERLSRRGSGFAAATLRTLRLNGRVNPYA